MEEPLVLSALQKAIDDRAPRAGLIHHSDRGKQYTARAYQKLLGENEMVCSMSRRGNCWDNACVESFFSTLKRELPNEHAFKDWREVDQAVFEYIDAHYNTRRPHSALGYLTPKVGRFRGHVSAMIGSSRWRNLYGPYGPYGPYRLAGLEDTSRP
jgi:putative transposase